MIECSGISKHFRVARREAGFRNACKAFFRRETTVVPALDNISFSIADGEMVGYIGPNACRKKHHHQNHVRCFDAGQRQLHHQRAHAVAEPDSACG